MPPKSARRTSKVAPVSSTSLRFLSWEFEESEEDPVTSIPYQLQRLFVLLQTSKKRAIETTDVTRSFGWDSSEGERAPHSRGGVSL